MRTRWTAVLVLVGAGVVAALQIGKAVGALPAIRADTGVSLAVGGWVISAVNLAGGIFGLLIGAGADRIGHRRSALAGLATVAAGSLLGAAAPGAMVLLTTRFVEGVGLALTVLSVPPLLRQLSAERDRGLVMGIWGAFMPAGTTLGILAAPVAAGLGGWRLMWAATAALAAGWLLLVALATRDIAGTRHASGRLLPTLRAVLASRGPLRLTATFAAYSLQYLSVVAFLPTLLLTEYRLSPAWAAALSSAVTVANVPGNILGGWLRGRGVPRWSVICAASVLMGLSGIAVYAGGLGLGWRLAAAALLSLAGGMIPATALAAALDVAPSPAAAATTVGVVMQGGILGQFAGPPLVAAVADAAGGWGATPLVLCIAAAAATMLALTLRRLERSLAAR
ncbi:CynX/NimT family MFS transporter [Fodinicola acaciae]|uniref:MFS transporter n=1 Tax=Fodinicola acaciae TaxID=2681555 RepID=UPI0013D698B2|nr:MFS transporter [Fodinicola acaciae]